MHEMLNGTIPQFALPYQPPDPGDHALAERLLSVQMDIWTLELEQARVRTLLKKRRAIRQHLAREARHLNRNGA